MSDKAPQIPSQGGRTSDGRFGKGNRVNPGGRPKGVKGLAAMIQELTDDGLELVKLCRSVIKDAKAARKDKLHACEILFERGWGKPLATIELSGGVDVKADLSKLSNDQLDALLRAAEIIHAAQPGDAG